MDTILVAILGTLALLFYVAARPGMGRAGLSLPSFYLLGLFLYAIGASLVFASNGDMGSHAVVLMSLTALFTGALGCIFGLLLFERTFPRDYARQNLAVWTVSPAEESWIFWGLGISAFVCLGFSVQVLRNQAISSLLADVFSIFDQKNLLQARKAITTGSEGYFAPGIVKQFRDILIPILLGAVILIATRQRLTSRQKLMVLATGASAVLAMLLSGVRSNLFLFFIALYAAYAVAQRVYGKMSRRKTRRQILFILIAVVAYGVLTVLLGRANSDQGRVSLAANIISNLFQRIVMVVPQINVATYPYWVTLGPTYGDQWLSDLRGILPGAPPITLYNILHQYMGGSLEGNASLGLPVDVWLNWGWIGLVVVPWSYGVFLVYFDAKLTRMRSPVAFGIKIVLAIALVKIYNPYGFILYGGMVSMLLYLGLKILRPRQPRQWALQRPYSPAR